MNTRRTAIGTRASIGIRAALISEHEFSVLMEDVDAEDASVYLPMHDENGWVARMVVQHFAETMASEDGWEYLN